METISWDQSRLNAAIRERLKLPGRTEAQVVNTAAYWVAVNAKRLTPFTTVARIDADLNVEIAPRFSKKGKMLPYSRKKRNYASVAGTARTAGVPLAALIVNSQVIRPDIGKTPSAKTFNFRTNFRYARHSSPFRGVSRAAGRAAMRGAVNRMIKARHSSIKFIRSGWIWAIRTLNPLSVQRFRRGETPPMDDAKTAFSKIQRGDAIPAKEGSWSVEATIENSTGMDGINGARNNGALLRVGAGPLEEALNIEARLMEEYIERAYAKQDAKFNEMCL